MKFAGIEKGFLAGALVFAANLCFTFRHSPMQQYEIFVVVSGASEYNH
jgi:hypothetical protein